MHHSHVHVHVHVHVLSVSVSMDMDILSAIVVSQISLNRSAGASLTKGIHSSQLIQDVLGGDFLHTEPEGK